MTSATSCSRCSTPRSPRNWCLTANGAEQRGHGGSCAQDFSLFEVLRYGFRPSKIAFLAWYAWSDPERGDWPPDARPTNDRPSLADIRRWLTVFAQRYYSFSQFKRSALPNGPKGFPWRLVVAAQ